MRSPRKVLVATILVSTVAVQAVEAARAWHAPYCWIVLGGKGAVTFSRDEGATTALTIPGPQPPASTSGLVTLETPNVLLAVRDRTLLRSRNAGCTWRDVATFPRGSSIHLTAAGGGAYAWSDNDSYLARIDGTTVRDLVSPADHIVGLGVDPVDPGHIRLADGDGTLYDSVDGGARWVPIGEAPFQESRLYRAAFDPADIEHLIVGAAHHGAAVTDNGGITWQSASGLSSSGGPVNVFNLVFSTSQTVFAMGLDIDENLEDAPSDGRHIYYSHDGGRSYARIADQRPGLVLRNGPIMAAHPTEPHIVYVVFGTYFDDYGTDIYRINAWTHTVSTTHTDYDDIRSIAFNRADPAVMYLGTEAVQIN